MPARAPWMLSLLFQGLKTVGQWVGITVSFHDGPCHLHVKSDNGMVSPGVVIAWMWILGLPSQAASHVASEQSTFVPTEQSYITVRSSLRTALGANLRTDLTLLLGPNFQLDMMGLAIFLSSGCVG